MKIIIALVPLLFLVVESALPQTFTRHPKLLQVGPNPSAIVAADLNGDGWPEIVTCDIGNLSSPRDERPANDELSYLVAQGGLLYIAQPPLRAGFAPYAVVAVNVDALKALDLVVGSFHAVNRQAITLFRNIGGNLFEPVYFTMPVDAVPYTKQRDGDEQPVFTKPGITSLVVADITKDGFRDVVATGWASDVLAFLPGAEKGYFGEPKFIPAPGGPRDVACADFDGDGNLDLVLTLYNANTVAIWKGNGKGEFAQAARFSSRGNLPHKVRVSDINGDGKPDVAVSHCGADDSIVIFYGDGGFVFAVSQEIALAEDHGRLEHGIRDLVVEDLNGDKRPDIAVACFESKQVAVFFNDTVSGDIAQTGTSATRAIPQRFRKEIYPFKDARPRALCTADFDKNGRTDLGVALWESNAVALLLSKTQR